MVVDLNQCTCMCAEHCPPLSFHVHVYVVGLNHELDRHARYFYDRTQSITHAMTREL